MGAEPKSTPVNLSGSETTSVNIKATSDSRTNGNIAANVTKETMYKSRLFGPWDKDNPVHCLCLFLVFQPHIQASLNRTHDALHRHKIKTAGHRTPLAMYELSREQAIRRGYWTGDIETIVNDPFYGEEGALDGNSIIPLPEGLEEGLETHLNEDLHLELAHALPGDFEYERDDGNWGIEVYCEVVIRMNNVLRSDDIDISW